MAVAFHFAQHGHRVSLYSRAEHAHHNLEAVRAKGVKSQVSGCLLAAA
jgi:hypothetical protein